MERRYVIIGGIQVGCNVLLVNYEDDDKAALVAATLIYQALGYEPQFDIVPPIGDSFFTHVADGDLTFGIMVCPKSWNAFNVYSNACEAIGEMGIA